MQTAVKSDGHHVSALRGRMASFPKPPSYLTAEGLRDGIEEIAKLAMGQEIGGSLVASADIGLLMLRQAAHNFLQSRAEASAHN